MHRSYLRRLVPVLIVLFLGQSCNDFSRALRTNPFEKKVPIRICRDDLKFRYEPFIDNEPFEVKGLDIDLRKDITLFEPIVRLSSIYAETPDDFTYLERKSKLIQNFVAGSFVSEPLVVGVAEPILSEDEYKVITSELIGNILNARAIDYTGWKADERLFTNGLKGYSLLIILEGHVGYRNDKDNLNEAFWFLLDNDTKKVAYADHFSFSCDIRNYEGLDRLVDFGYNKMILAGRG